MTDTVVYSNVGKLLHTISPRSSTGALDFLKRIGSTLSSSYTHTKLIHFTSFYWKPSRQGRSPWSGNGRRLFQGHEKQALQCIG